MRSHVAALMFLLAPGSALADGPMTTATPAPSLPAAAPAAPLNEADAGAPGDGSSVRMGPCGPQAVAPDGKTDTRAHGYVEAGVGTSGYRHIAAGVCKPIGENGAIAVSVGQTQVQGRRFGP
jgi:hypothetical protein